MSDEDGQFMSLNCENLMLWEQPTHSDNPLSQAVWVVHHHAETTGSYG